MHDARILRLEAARDRIMTSHDPLKVVAAETGLGNATHLSRLFRRYLIQDMRFFGIVWREWRRRRES